MLTPEGILAIVTTAASSAVSVAGLGWWLAGKFSDVKEAASENLASHEKRDQQRHEETCNVLVRSTWPSPGSGTETVLVTIRE